MGRSAEVLVIDFRRWMDVRTPGFTAEASLNPATAHYNSLQGAKNIQSARTIVPQTTILDCFCLPSGKYCCCRGADGKWVCATTISTFSAALSRVS